MLLELVLIAELGASDAHQLIRAFIIEIVGILVACFSPPHTCHIVGENFSYSPKRFISLPHQQQHGNYRCKLLRAVKGK